MEKSDRFRVGKNNNRVGPIGLAKFDGESAPKQFSSIIIKRINKITIIGIEIPLPNQMNEINIVSANQDVVISGNKTGFGVVNIHVKKPVFPKAENCKWILQIIKNTRFAVTILGQVVQLDNIWRWRLRFFPLKNCADSIHQGALIIRFVNKQVARFGFGKISNGGFGWNLHVKFLCIYGKFLKAKDYRLKNSNLHINSCFGGAVAA